MIDIINSSRRKNMTTQLWWTFKLQTLFPISVEGSRTRPFDTLKPRFVILSANFFLRVLACNNNPIYNGTGVSCEILCLPEDDVFGARLCLVLLNFDIWAMVSADGDVPTAI